jgi:hypothetical protein
MEKAQNKFRHSLEEDGNTLNTIGELIDKDDSLLSSKGFSMG